MALGGIGMAGGDQALDDHDHLSDVLGRARLLVRRQFTKGRHVGVVVGSGARGDGADRLARLLRTCVDLVIHIRDVPDIGNLRIKQAQQPSNDVVDDVGAGVTEMRQVVDCRAAYIHADVGWIGRLKPLLAAGKAIVQVKLGHRRRSTRRPDTLWGALSPKHRANATRFDIDGKGG